MIVAQNLVSISLSLQPFSQEPLDCPGSSSSIGLTPDTERFSRTLVLCHCGVPKPGPYQFNYLTTIPVYYHNTLPESSTLGTQ